MITRTLEGGSYTTINQLFSPFCPSVRGQIGVAPLLEKQESSPGGALKSAESSTKNFLNKALRLSVYAQIFGLVLLNLPSLQQAKISILAWGFYPKTAASNILGV